MLSVLLFIFRIWQSTGCLHFAGFYFNPISAKINVEEQRNLDKNTNYTISRVFHNKISAQFWEVNKSYIFTFNPRYLLEILGPLGLFLVIVSVSKIVKNPKSIYTLSFFAVCAASLFLILPIDPRKTFYLSAISWYIFALISTPAFAKSKKGNMLFPFLLLASFWYFAFSWQQKAICNEIFFN